MKKITRKQKREKEEEINFFVEFIKIKNHFFKSLNSMLKSVKDNRHKSYIEYSLDILLFLLITKNISGIKSMDKMTDNFSRSEKSYDLIRNLNYGITKISSTVLDSFRRDIITIEDISKLDKRTQIRSL